MKVVCGVARLLPARQNAADTFSSAGLFLVVPISVLYIRERELLPCPLSSCLVHSADKYFRCEEMHEKYA